MKLSREWPFLGKLPLHELGICSCVYTYTEIKRYITAVSRLVWIRESEFVRNSKVYNIISVECMSTTGIRTRSDQVVRS